MGFYLTFKYENEEYTQEYCSLNDNRILQYGINLHKKKRLDRWAIYPNMKSGEIIKDRVYGFHQHSRDDIMNQHMEEYKICSVEGIKQYVSIFYTDKGVPNGFSENMMIIYFDHSKRIETVFAIPIKGKKLKLKKMTKITRSEDFSPMNYMGKLIEKFGSYAEAVKNLNNFSSRMGIA